MNVILLFLIVFIAGLALSILFRSNKIDDEAIWISPWLGIVFIISIIISASFAKIPINISSIYVMGSAIIIILLFAAIFKGIPLITFSTEFKSTILFFIASIVIFHIIPISAVSMNSSKDYFLEKTMIDKMTSSQISQVTDYTVGGTITTLWVSSLMHINLDSAQVLLQTLLLSLLFTLFLITTRKFMNMNVYLYIVFFLLYHIGAQLLLGNGIITPQLTISTGVILTIIYISYSYLIKFSKKKQENYFTGEEFIISLCLSGLIIFQPNVVKILMVILFGISTYLLMSKHFGQALIPFRILLLTIFINPILVGFLIHI